MTFSTRYKHHTVPGVTNNEPSRTKQEFAAEADINTIMRKYERQGLALPEGNREPMFGDFSAPELADYAQAVATVQGTGDLMKRLPAKVRQRFQNDPLNLIAFVMDPKNAQEAFDLGLLREDYESPSKPPAQTPPATPPTPPGKAP